MHPVGPKLQPVHTPVASAELDLANNGDNFSTSNPFKLYYRTALRSEPLAACYYRRFWASLLYEQCIPA